MAALSVDGTPMPALPNSADQINYDNTTSGLSATTVKGGIDELASEKQDATDNNLTTTDKTIVGGINELKSGLTNLHFEAIDTNISVTTTDTSTEITSISGYSALLFVAKASNTVRGSLYIPYTVISTNVDCYILGAAGTDMNSIYVKRVDDTHLILSTTLQTLNTLDIYGIK